MLRSSERTPASRVYSAASRRSASSVSVTSVASRPARSSCRASRWSRAIVDLLVLGVAVQADQLHPVEQRLGDGLDHVGRGDEQHVGQVELDLEVVVAERVVLRRVEHLEQRGRRVAPVVGAELVDLVQQDDRVHRAGLADGPDDAARQRADVGAPVPADLRLVADAAERDAGELAAHGAGDRLAERGLADAGRPAQRQHGAAAPPADQLQAPVGAPLAHGEVLDDPVLDVIQAGVVGVQHARAPVMS